MLDPKQLFARRMHQFENVEEEIAAVRDRRKGLAWYPMTRAQIETYTDYDDVVTAARAAGLSVLTIPRPPEEVLRTNAVETDVFVLHHQESWRADAFLACSRALGVYQWSDSSEYLFSRYLGYAEDDCVSWIRECRYNRLGWIGQTVYSLIENERLRSFEPQAFACFAASFDAENLVVITQPDGWLLRRDLDAILPDGVSLCRFALDSDFFLGLMCSVNDSESRESSLSMRIGVPVQRLNEALVSHIELWVRNRWEARRTTSRARMFGGNSPGVSSSGEPE